MVIFLPLKWPFTQNIPDLSRVNRRSLWHQRFKVTSLKNQNSKAMMFYYLKTICIFFMFFLEALMFVQELEGVMFGFFMFTLQFCLTVFISEDKYEVWVYLE